MSDTLEPFPLDWSRALAVVAHPDDVEFGAAGAVASWTAAGKNVGYLLLTRGEAGIDSMSPDEAAIAREAEQRASAKIVGVNDVEFLDYADGIIEYGVGLRRDLAHALRRARPELIILFNHHETFPGGKRNSPDHRNTGAALLDAVGDAGNRWIFPQDGVEPWNGVRYIAVASSPHTTHGVDITDTLDIAVASLEAHASYLEGIGLTQVRGPLTGITAKMGQQLGVANAIAFELITR